MVTNMGFRIARISGLVSYLNEKGQRVAIPNGPCEISHNDMMGPYIIRWCESGASKEVELTLKEFAHYESTRNFVILD